MTTNPPRDQRTHVFHVRFNFQQPLSKEEAAEVLRSIMFDGIQQLNKVEAEVFDAWVHDNLGNHSAEPPLIPCNLQGFSFRKAHDLEWSKHNV